jgi:hypothetical protein
LLRLRAQDMHRFPWLESLVQLLCRERGDDNPFKGDQSTQDTDGACHSSAFVADEADTYPASMFLRRVRFVKDCFHALVLRQD